MSQRADERCTLPYLTADLPGVGGRIKQHDEDFQVQEIPLYEPAGEGTHVYFTIEKQGLTTQAAIGQIARALGRKPRELGYAGLKDAHAITRQTLSIEHVDPNLIHALDLPRIKVHTVSRHRNKLRRGHLSGNRFALKLRDIEPGTIGRVRLILDTLARRGVPNYFGPQRFGLRGDNWRIGRATLRGDYQGAIHAMVGDPSPLDGDDVGRARRLFDAGECDEAMQAWPKAFAREARLCGAVRRCQGDFARAWMTVDRPVRKIYLNAYQSHLFNHLLAARIDSIGRLETGDLAWIHHNGACFPVEDAVREQPRCDAFEISPTGPMFGRKMTAPKGEPGGREARVLAESGLQEAGFRTPDGMVVDGARRPLRVPLGEYDVQAGCDEHGHFIELTFALPPGSYATCVTREVCKNDDERIVADQ